MYQAGYQLSVLARSSSRARDALRRSYAPRSPIPLRASAARDRLGYIIAVFSRARKTIGCAERTGPAKKKTESIVTDDDAGSLCRNIERMLNCGRMFVSRIASPRDRSPREFHGARARKERDDSVLGETHTRFVVCAITSVYRVIEPLVLNVSSSLIETARLSTIWDLAGNRIAPRTRVFDPAQRPSGSTRVNERKSR